MNQQQQLVIDYLREENRVLKEQLGGRRLQLNNDQRRRLAAKPNDWAPSAGRDDLAPTKDSKPTQTCRTGAAKWASSALDLRSKLFFVSRLRGCSTVRKDPTPPEMGQRFFGGKHGRAGWKQPEFYPSLGLSRTGSKAWEYSLSNNGGSGTLATAGELVFFGESGRIHGAQFQNRYSRVAFRNGPDLAGLTMTYMVGGKQ